MTVDIKCTVQAAPLAQTVFKIEADSLHLTLVGRFLYDIMHFVTEAKEIASVLSAPSPPAASGGQPEQPADSYRPITEVRGCCDTLWGCLIDQKAGMKCTEEICGCCQPVQQVAQSTSLPSLCSCTITPLCVTVISLACEQQSAEQCCQVG